MSQDNVERLRAQLVEWDPKAQVEAWKRGEAVGDLSLIDPEVTYEDQLLPDHVAETYHGYEGVARTFRDRKVVHIHGYFDPAEGLQAAGLQE
jgi:hypothetical protein